MTAATVVSRRQDMPESESEKPARPVALTARNCSISFGRGQQARTVLDNVTVEVAQEEIVCVIGPSGCGKTTLLRALAGLQEVTAGEVVFEGGPVKRPMRDLAVVFQDYGKALLPWRTVQQNVGLALEARRVPAGEHAKRIAPLLAQVGLQNYANHFPVQLSGGLQQRAQIARSLALQPKVLLMDEPFGALDAMTRQSLQDELLRLASNNRMTVLFITHDLRGGDLPW